MLQKFEDRRQTPRHGIARVAKIQLGIGTTPLCCIITDISEGACVSMPIDSKFPTNLGYSSTATVLSKMEGTG
jgi:hypothetical protein